MLLISTFGQAHLKGFLKIAAAVKLTHKRVILSIFVYTARRAVTDTIAIVVVYLFTGMDSAKALIRSKLIFCCGFVPPGLAS